MTSDDIITAEDIRRYHSAGPKSLGSTRISHFREHGPVWWKLRYIDGAIEAPETSDAMKQGSLMDCMLTEPEKYATRYIAKPEGMSFATKDGRAWKASQPDGVIIVPPDWIAIAQDCCAAVANHATANRMLQSEGCRSQVTLRHALPSGITLQSRPDYLALNEATMDGWYIDLKKTDDLDAFGRKAIDYGYHRQLALAQWLAARAGYRIAAYLLAVEWQRGARARLFRMPEACLEYGWREVKDTVDEIAQRFTDDDWSDDHDGDVDELEVPHWMMAKLESGT